MQNRKAGILKGKMNKEKNIQEIKSEFKDDLCGVFDRFATNYAGEVDDQVMSRENFIKAVEFMKNEKIKE